jgi:hypothetical protein
MYGMQLDVWRAHARVAGGVPLDVLEAGLAMAVRALPSSLSALEAAAAQVRWSTRSLLLAICFSLGVTWIYAISCWETVHKIVHDQFEGARVPKRARAKWVVVTTGVTVVTMRVHVPRGVRDYDAGCMRVHDNDSLIWRARRSSAGGPASARWTWARTT